MREKASWRDRHGFRRQLLRANDVGFATVRHPLDRAAGEHTRQPAPRLGRSRGDLDGALEKVDRPQIAFPCGWLEQNRPSPENVVECAGMFGLPRQCGVDELKVERNGDPARHLVLQCEQLAYVTIKALGP